LLQVNKETPLVHHIHAQDSHSAKLRCICCKMLVKFNLAQLGQQPSYRDQLVLVDSLKTCFRGLYCVASELQQNTGSSGSGSSSPRARAVSLTVSVSSSSVSPRGSFESNKKRGSFTADSAGSNENGDGDMLVELSLISQCSDFMSSVWQRFTGDIMRLQESCIADYENNVGASDDSGVSTDIIDAGVLQLSLLEAASFAAGVVRIHSYEAMNRRRLLREKIVERVKEGLNASENAADTLCNSSSSSGSSAAAMADHDSDNDDDEDDEEEDDENDNNNANTSDLFMTRWKAQFLSNLSQLLVQLTAILRNIALDSDGRAQLLESGIITKLCRIMKPFKVGWITLLPSRCVMLYFRYRNMKN
jgi:hypothetical protein